MGRRCIGGVDRGDHFEFDNGPTVPMEALQLLRTLDVRGIQLQKNGDRLRVYREDGAELVYQEGERDAIARWKHHLMAIVELGISEPIPDTEKNPAKKRSVRK